MVCFDTPCSPATEQINRERIRSSATKGSIGAIIVYRSYMVFLWSASRSSTPTITTPVVSDSSPMVHSEQDSRAVISIHTGIVLLIQSITRTLSPCTSSTRMMFSPDQSRSYFFINDHPPIRDPMPEPVIPRSIQQLHRQRLHQELTEYALPDHQITISLSAYEV